jgi:uncharacterized protein (TIGR02145 family)
MIAVTSALVLAGCGGGGGGKLTTDVTPSDGGTVSRDINQTIYPNGTNVTLTAKAADGYKFKEWKGAVTGNTKTISVATVGNMKVTAVFEKLPALTIGGKNYRIVQIGNQTWMAENLNLETPNSWCIVDIASLNDYEGNPANCEKYGRLYTWDAAKSACPGGWHLPTREEWNELVSFAGGDNAGTKLKSKYPDWNGADEFAFSALPGGHRYTDGGFGDPGSHGNWWSATEIDASDAYTRTMGTSNAIVYEYNGNKDIGFSVRCLYD